MIEKLPGVYEAGMLFPDYKAISETPDFIRRDTGWVADFMASVKHVPFTRIKSLHADITAEDANEGTSSSITVAPDRIEINSDSTSIHNLETPINDGDAANKEYIDNTIASLPSVSLATETTNGLLSADDKKILNGLNPNIEKTISNLNASEFNVINAK